ncbi:hypothetical protein GLYMA_01G244000v4 [Glycine max]|uniref:Uncharacterized protein n=2 Tax=Glycine subgen. Soja TaxID=1462606 RepID=K7K5M5_SOYBN|nr:hypothetical protein JHK86_002754 [Glycine max]KAH1164536.1 hypothetical protein GYH30_002526 [Glycine max]KRH77953.1 hypothetical protein GLYMA_01G244000v4 [Glycine max]RZC31700.1 hypothetical protein D0Y65_002511 [Glycine soja]
MKRGYNYLSVAIYVMMFLVLVSYSSIKVEGMRPLKADPSFISLIINRAYSGPSHRGRGH